MYIYIYIYDTSILFRHPPRGLRCEGQAVSSKRSLLSTGFKKARTGQSLGKSACPDSGLWALM